jgi:hypothetical protein
MSMGISVVQTTPDYAFVYVDHDKKTYYSPAYLYDIGEPGALKRSIDIENLQLTKIEDVHDAKYDPDDECRNEGYFMQEYSSYFRYLLEKIGILKPVQSRWNKDGTWNW